MPRTTLVCRGWGLGFGFWLPPLLIYSYLTFTLNLIGPYPLRCRYPPPPFLRSILLDCTVTCLIARTVVWLRPKHPPQKKKKKKKRKQVGGDDLTKKLIHLLRQGEVRKAAALCSEQAERGGTVSFCKKIASKLRELHPVAKEDPGPMPDFDPRPEIADGVTEAEILVTARRLRGAPGPSGMPTHLVRTLLRQKTASARSLRGGLVQFTKRLMTSTPSGGCLEPFLACRLVALPKDEEGNSIRPVGIGEAWRRTVLKTVGRLTKDEVMRASGIKQVSSGHKAACEASAHFMRRKVEGGAEMVLLVDARNAFNRARRSRLLRTVAERTPALGRVAWNVYSNGAILVLPDGSQIMSTEGTTQGCPIAMQSFAIGVMPLIEGAEGDKDFDQTWYADDSGGVGSVEGVAAWFGRVSPMLQVPNAMHFSRLQVLDGEEDRVQAVMQGSL